MLDIDFNSQSWFAVKSYVGRRLETLRRRNDSALSMEETCTIRGTIAAMKDILALETAPEIVADE